MEAVGVEEELGLGFPFWFAARRRFKPGDPFFAAGDIERELIAKHVIILPSSPLLLLSFLSKKSPFFDVILLNFLDLLVYLNQSLEQFWELE